MSHISKSFKDFVRQQLNEEISQQPIITEIKNNGKAWVEELIEKYNELIQEYDYLSRQF